MMKQAFHIIIVLIAAAVLAACGRSEIEPTPTATPRPTATPLTVGGQEEETKPTEAPPTTAPVEADSLQPYGPTDFPSNVSPLTGIAYPEEEADRLDRRPLLVRVSAFPPSAVMPHSGLQDAAHVWEHVVEGFAITRYTAVYLANEPERVGSVRSGRPPDLELVPMYQGLYSASGFSTNSGNADLPWRMREYMLNANWRPRNFSPEFGFGAPFNIRLSERSSPHNLFAVPAEIWAEADERDINQRPTIEGLAFAPTPPAGGTPTTEAIVDYAGVGARATWTWDADREVWLRTVSGDVSTETIVHEDDLTGEQLAFDNVVIIYAFHSQTDFIEDEASQLLAVQIDLFGEGTGWALRDGQRYPIRWQREGSQSENMIALLNEDGTPFELMNGNTWFQVASNFGRGDDPTISFDGEVQE